MFHVMGIKVRGRESVDSVCRRKNIKSISMGFSLVGADVVGIGALQKGYLVAIRIADGSNGSMNGVREAVEITFRAVGSQDRKDLVRDEREVE